MRQHVSEGTVFGLALVVGVGAGRIMGLRIGEKGEKRLLGFGLALDEIDGVVGDLAIDRSAWLGRTLPALWALDLAFPT